MKLFKLCFYSLLTIAALTDGQLFADQITYTTIATSSAGSTHGLSIPSITNNGTVAFADTSGTGGTLFTAAGGTLSAVVSSPTYFSAYGSGGQSSPVGASPSLNDTGSVAFWARTPAAPFTINTGIISGTQASLNTIVTGTGFANFSTSPQISDNGTVVFAGYHNGGSPGVGVYSYAGGNTSTLALNATFTGSHSTDPAISHNGTIAYEWPTFGQFGGLTGDNLYVEANGVTTLVASTTSHFFNSVAVNNSGAIVTSSTHLLEMADGGGLSTLADSSGAFSTFGTASINNPGEFAFLATLYSGSTGNFSGSTGIFNGNDAVADKIIATGDSLNGSTVISLAFGREGINDQGQIVFWAGLANGEQGVFVASPVPEPSSAILLTLGGLGACFYGYRRAYGSSFHCTWF